MPQTLNKSWRDMLGSNYVEVYENLTVHRYGGIKGKDILTIFQMMMDILL